MKLKISKQYIPNSKDKYSNLFLFGIPIGGAAGDKVKEEQRAREEQNKLNAETIRIQQEQERIENERKRQQAEAEARMREIEAQMALENVKAKNLELELRKAEALQKIAFQQKMGETAVERASKLNEIEAIRENKHTEIMPIKTYIILGGVFLIFILIFILLKK